MLLYEDVEKYGKQVARKKYVKENLPLLKERKVELEKQVEELGKKKKSEDKDVERIEGYTLTAFIYSALGKKDEKLDKEKEEAYEATVKYELVVDELEEVNKDIRAMEYDLECYGKAEVNYEKAMDMWIENMTAFPLSEEETKHIRYAQIELGQIRDKRNRIKESLKVAGRAIGTTKGIISDLDEAKRWGISDLILNRGFYSDYAQLEKLKDVEKNLRVLNTDIYKIKNELKEINDTGQLLLDLSTDWSAADMYFDFTLIEFAQFSEIKKAKKSAEEFIQQLEEVHDNIKKKDEELLEKELNMAKEISELLEKMER